METTTILNYRVSALILPCRGSFALMSITAAVPTNTAPVASPRRRPTPLQTKKSPVYEPDSPPYEPLQLSTGGTPPSPSYSPPSDCKTRYNRRRSRSQSPKRHSIAAPRLIVDTASATLAEWQSWFKKVAVTSGRDTGNFVAALSYVETTCNIRFAEPELFGFCWLDRSEALAVNMPNPVYEMFINSTDWVKGVCMQFGVVIPDVEVYIGRGRNAEALGGWFMSLNTSLYPPKLVPAPLPPVVAITATTAAAAAAPAAVAATATAAAPAQAVSGSRPRVIPLPKKLLTPKPYPTMSALLDAYDLRRIRPVGMSVIPPRSKHVPMPRALPAGSPLPPITSGLFDIQKMLQNPGDYLPNPPSVVHPQIGIHHPHGCSNVTCPQLYACRYKQCRGCFFHCERGAKCFVMLIPPSAPTAVQFS